MDVFLQVFNRFVADILPRPELKINQTVVGVIIRICRELKADAVNQRPDPPIDDLFAGRLVMFLRVHHLGEREKTHHYLLRQRQSGGVVQCHVATVGDNTIDELDLTRLKRQCAIALVERFNVGSRQVGDHLIENVALVHRDDTEPPAGAAKVLRVGIDADRVLRQFSEQRAEIVDESSVDVVGQQHQVGTLGLHQLCDLADGFLAHCHAGGIAGIDDEEGFDLRILQLLDFLIGVLEAVLLGSFDMHDLEVVVLSQLLQEVHGQAVGVVEAEGVLAGDCIDRRTLMSNPRELLHVCILAHGNSRQPFDSLAELEHGLLQGRPEPLLF